LLRNKILFDLIEIFPYTANILRKLTFTMQFNTPQIKKPRSSVFLCVAVN